MISSSISPLAGITFEPLFQDHGLPLAVMGILVVFAALVLVIIVITLLPRVISVLEQWHPEKKETPASAKPKPQPPHESPDELLVVVAAAVDAAFDQPHRIIRTREATPDARSWSRQGRTEHHTSHRRKH